MSFEDGIKTGLYIKDYKVGEGGMHFYERYAAYIPFNNWVVPAIFARGNQGFGDYICAFNKINFAANDNTILEAIAA